MNYTQQQGDAINRIAKWALSKGGPQVFRLFGYAGTGKTTLAKEVASRVTGTIFAAYTGKAALVLRSKGCDAKTIHSLIYKASEDPLTGEVTYDLNPDSDVAMSSLVCIDECSMVNEEQGRDLLSFGTKVLVLGDPAQLPPVSGEGFFTAGEPDVLLTEVHRQAEDNPIIAMSMWVRQDGALAPGEYGTSRVISRASVSRDELRDLVMSCDQMLVGRNATRETFNRRVRQIRWGASVSGIPVSGDKLVCLRNNHRKGLLNGSLWSVKGTPSRRGSQVDMLLDSMDCGDRVVASTHEAFFRGAQSELDWRALRKQDQLTYGYALTVHKSQGSQWPNVLVIDESRAFREHAARHLYTALTRAADRVTVVVD